MLLAESLDLLKEKSFKVNANQSLIVKTDLGDITTKTWDKNEVYVKIFGNNNAEKAMEFSFDQDENGVEVIGEKEGGFLSGWFKRLSLKYEIMVPANFNLNYKTAGGDIVTNKITGELKFKTSGGDIYLSNSMGELNGSTSGGDITIKNFKGTSDVSTSGGDIDIVAEGGFVSASTSGGDIKITSSNGKVNAGTSGGDVSLNYTGENQGIKLATSGGDIDIKIPSNFSAEAEIKTSGGDISSNFSNVKKSKISKSKLIGTFNNGGNSLVCKTSGGDITVREK